MKVIIAGGRNYRDYETLRSEMNILIVPSKIEEIVSGSCSTGELTFTREDGTKVYGADGLGERYAKEMGFLVKPFPAAWKKYGKRAGVIRNNRMAEYATHAVCFWDGKSRGTQSMIDLAKAHSLNLTIIRV